MDDRYLVIAAYADDPIHSDGLFYKVVDTYIEAEALAKDLATRRTGPIHIFRGKELKEMPWTRNSSSV